MSKEKDRFVETRNAKYKILPTVLGVGGTSVVRLGERVSDKKLFALKFFKNASINDIQSAEAEYERSKALGFHPNLVNTVDFDTNVTYPIHPDDGGGTQTVMAVLVMDYCPHGTLIDLLMQAGENMLSMELATHVCKQLLTVLAYIHDKKVAHCDLKWEQTLLDSDFNVKLADFGSASMNFEKRSSWLGTPSYWSPEQHEDGSGFWSKVHPEKADMFAAAVMLHIAYTSKPPFGEANDRDWFWARLSRPGKRDQYYMYMEKYGIKLPKQIRPIFEAMCSWDPEDRPHASELLQNELFKKQMSSNKYTDAMRKFYENAYPQKESRMKGFEGFRDEMSSLSLHNQHLFRGENDEKKGIKPPQVEESDLISNTRNVTLYMPSHIPTSQASKVVIRATDVLRDLGAFVTIKKHAPFVGEAKWNEMWKEQGKEDDLECKTSDEDDDTKGEGGSWGSPNTTSDFSINLVPNHKQQEEPLLVNLKVACLNRRLVIQIKHLQGAIGHFRDVCSKFEDTLSSPSMTHESEDSKERFVNTKTATYRILPEVLGVGGTSVVRLGERQSDKKKFAMKFFKTLSASDLENAKEEYRMSKLLGEHPHLVNVVDFEQNVKFPLHEKDGSGVMNVPALLVTDYCPNHSVIDFLMELAANGKHLDEDCAKMLIQQLLKALIHIHSKRVAHCDLKFEQCLLDENFNLKLLDFGSAAMDLKHRDEWLATPSYWSPEQHAFGSGFWSAVDPDKADMFAFGALIHIALTSTPPFAEASPRCPYWSALSSHSGPERFFKYMKMNGIRLPESAKKLFLSVMRSNQKERLSASAFLEQFQDYFATSLSQENYSSKMRHFREIAFPSQDVNADEDMDYESKFRDELAECNAHDRHLFRCGDINTHRVPNMKVFPDTIRSRSIRFGVLSTGKMSNVARTEFVKLTRFVNSIGGTVTSRPDEPFTLDVVFPALNDKDVVVDKSVVIDEKKSPVPLLQRHDKKKKQTEKLRIACKFGRIEVARHPQLSLCLRHLSGNLNRFRDFVSKMFKRIEMDGKKKKNNNKIGITVSGPTLSLSKSMPHSRHDERIAETKIRTGKDKDCVDTLGHTLHLGFVGACPLVDESGTALAHLDVPREMEVLNDVIGRSGGVRWSALVGSDTTDHLRRALTSGCCILHVSAHGTSSGELLLEAHSPPGTVFRFSGHEFARLIQEQGVRRPRLLVLMNCYSESVARCLQDTVDHIVCVDERFPILDSAVVTFTRELYRCIFHGKTVLSAFRQAREAVRSSTNDEKMKEAADRFKLVGDDEMRHQKFIFSPIDTTKRPSQFGNCKEKPAKYPSPIPNFVGRDNDLIQLLRTFDRKRTRSFVMMHGPRGVGKTALATTLGRYMYSHKLCDDLFVIGPNDSERLSAHELRQPGRLLAKLGEDLRCETTLKTPSQINDWVIKHKRSFVIVDNCEPFFTNKKFLQVLNNLVSGDYGVKVLLLSRKPKRNLSEVMGSVSMMSVYPLQGLSPNHAALLFCTSSPRNLTCAEMGPKASTMRSIDENMRHFALSPVMNLFPSNLPERVVKAASLLEPTEPFDMAFMMQDWKQHYHLADKDADGMITTKEIREFLLNKGYKPLVIDKAFTDSRTKSSMTMKDFENLWKEWGPSVKLASILEEKMRDEETEQRYANTFPLESLNTRDIMMLMRVNGLGMFCRAFRDLGVDGSLLSMVESTLTLKRFDVGVRVHLPPPSLSLSLSFTHTHTHNNNNNNNSDAEDLEEIGVNTKLHRRKLFQLIRNWKESTQMVSREEIEEAEKLQLSYIDDSRHNVSKTNAKNKTRDDIRIQFSEHIRVSLSTAAFMLMRRMRGISNGYLLKTSESFRLSHWKKTKVYGDDKTIDEMVRLDDNYSTMTTLYAFGRYLAFHLLAMKNMSVFMDDDSPVHLYPSILRSVEFSLSGEGVDLHKLDGTQKHPHWELGSVKSGLFQLMSYDQVEIGESMLVRDESTELGCRCLSYVEFKKKYNKERSFRTIFSRLSMSCKALHSEKSVPLYCKDGNQLVLRNEYRGRCVWLHNQLVILVQQLDHNLALRSRDLTASNQQELYDTIERLIVEQEIQDLMRGYQRKLMCDSVFMRWCSESETKKPEKIDLKSLSCAVNHASKLSVNDRVENIIRRKRQLSIYSSADIGKSILNDVGATAETDRKTSSRSPPSSPEMPPRVPNIARSTSMRLPRSRHRNGTTRMY